MAHYRFLFQRIKQRGQVLIVDLAGQIHIQYFWVKRFLQVPLRSLYLEREGLFSSSVFLAK